MNVYDCQDVPFFDECAEDAWGELQRGLIDRNYPGPCMMQCAPPPAYSRAVAEQAHREQQAQLADAARQDWYKAREYDRQCRAAQNNRRAWMTSYDPMMEAQQFGYTTGPQMAPTVSTVYGEGSVPVDGAAPAEPPSKKKNGSAKNDDEQESFGGSDLTLGQILNSNVGMLLMLILVVLLYAMYTQSVELKMLRAMVPPRESIVVTPTIV